MIAKRAAIAVLILSCTMALLAKAPSAWVTGTIMRVTRHQPPSDEATGVDLWDVSLKVRDTMYVVLVEEAPGHHGVEYRAGMALNVLITPATVVFNDLLGRRHEAHILKQYPATDRRATKSAPPAPSK